MKDKIFHFFGNILEQSPLPTPLKLAIAFRLELLLFFLVQFAFRVLRTSADKRISEDFMKYIYSKSNDENLKKLELLKTGLDMQSKRLIDEIIRRQEHIFRHNLLDLRLLTKKERKDQQINIYPIKKKYRGFGNYYGIENFYFHCGLRFLSKNLLKKYEKKDVIDAGAANGDTPAIFSREYAFRNIYAFEPEKNKKLKITNEEGQSHISVHGNQDVEIVTIDEFVEKNNITVALIKMDIEGFEYNAVKGAEKTIKDQKPILLISIYHCGKDFFEIKPLLERWGGYKFMIKKLNPHHFFFDTMLIGVPI